MLLAKLWFNSLHTHLFLIELGKAYLWSETLLRHTRNSRIRALLFHELVTTMLFFKLV